MQKKNAERKTEQKRKKEIIIRETNREHFPTKENRRGVAILGPKSHCYSTTFYETVDVGEESLEQKHGSSPSQHISNENMKPHLLKIT